MQKTLQNKWNKLYSSAPKTLEKMAKIKTVASAFNTCIDSVVKISGEELARFIKDEKLSLKELENIEQKSINSVANLLRGIFNCFKKGIAEEWTADKPEMFEWMHKNLGTKKGLITQNIF